MPANVVKTKRDERLWSEAKQAAAKQGHEKDYAYIMGIYKRMKGEKSMQSVAKSFHELNDLEKGLEFRLIAAIPLHESDLEKGAGHKYIKRIATGKARPKYRYIYFVPKTKKLVSSDDLHSGAKFKAKHKGEHGHFEVLSHDADTNHVVIHHDESGEHIRMHKDDFHKMINSAHGQKEGIKEERKARKEGEKAAKEERKGKAIAKEKKAKQKAERAAKRAAALEARKKAAAEAVAKTKEKRAAKNKAAADEAAAAKKKADEAAAAKKKADEAAAEEKRKQDEYEADIAEAKRKEQAARDEVIKKYGNSQNKEMYQDIVRKKDIAIRYLSRVTPENYHTDKGQENLKFAWDNLKTVSGMAEGLARPYKNAPKALIDEVSKFSPELQARWKRLHDAAEELKSQKQQEAKAKEDAKKQKEENTKNAIAEEYKKKWEREQKPKAEQPKAEPRQKPETKIESKNHDEIKSHTQKIIDSLDKIGLPESEKSHLKEKFESLNQFIDEAKSENDEEMLSMVGDYYDHYMDDYQEATKNIPAPEPLKQAVQKEKNYLDHVFHGDIQALRDFHEKRSQLHRTASQQMKRSNRANKHQLSKESHDDVVKTIDSMLQNNKIDAEKLQKKIDKAEKRSREIIGANARDSRKSKYLKPIVKMFDDHVAQVKEKNNARKQAVMGKSRTFGFMGPNRLPINLSTDEFISKAFASGNLGSDPSLHAPTFHEGLIKAYGSPCMGLDKESLTRTVQASMNANFDPAGNKGQGGMWKDTPEFKAPVAPWIQIAPQVSVVIDDESQDARINSIGSPIK